MSGPDLANRLESGAIVYNVTFDRLWKENDETNGQGEVTKKGEWKQSASFGKDDLLLLGKIADLSHSWLLPQDPGRPPRRRASDQTFAVRHDTLGAEHGRSPHLFWPHHPTPLATL